MKKIFFIGMIRVLGFFCYLVHAKDMMPIDRVIWWCAALRLISRGFSYDYLMFNFWAEENNSKGGDYWMLASHSQTRELSVQTMHHNDDADSTGSNGSSNLKIDYFHVGVD